MNRQVWCKNDHFWRDPRLESEISQIWGWRCWGYPHLSLASLRRVFLAPTLLKAACRPRSKCALQGGNQDNLTQLPRLALNPQSLAQFLRFKPHHVGYHQISKQERQMIFCSPRVLACFREILQRWPLLWILKWIFLEVSPPNRSNESHICR